MLFNDREIEVSRPLVKPPSTLLRYGYAVAAGVGALGARVLLGTSLGYQHQYAMLYIAVLLSCWYGGVLPALVTIFIGAISTAFFAVAPGAVVFGFHRSNLVGLEFYFMVTLTATILFEAESRARQKSTRNARIASERLQQLQEEIERRKIAEQAASEAEEQFRLMVEHAPVGFCRLDLEGRFEDVNPQFCAITGYTCEELLGRTFREITHPDDLPQTLEGYRRVREGERRFFSQEKRYIRKDGAIIWGALTAAAVRSSDGHPRFLLGVVQDITRRRETEDQLREAQKLESVGMLAGGIAHDFNNLLTGVLGNASLAMETMPPESSARRLIESILSAAERAAQLTRQLLAYAGKGTFVRTAVDLSAVARQATTLVKVAAPPGVEFHLDLAKNLPPVVGDPAQMQQLITNLALNSVEAIGESDGTITIRTANAHFDTAVPAPVGKIASGDYVCVAVEDTGCGMDEAIVRRVFDPFFTTKFMGRGLGLAAVAGIVRSLAGAVLVHSRAGKGTTVEVLIPKP